MEQPKYDNETKAQLGRAQAIEAMLASAGWKYAEKDLFEFIAELKDISTIDLNGDTNQQIRDRKNLAESLLEWHGSLLSQVNNAIIMDSERDSGLIERR